MAALYTFNHILLPTYHTVPTLYLINLLKMIRTLNIIIIKDRNHQYFNFPLRCTCFNSSFKVSGTLVKSSSSSKTTLKEVFVSILTLFESLHISFYHLSHFYHQSNFNLKKSASKVEILTYRTFSQKKTAVLLDFVQMRGGRALPNFLSPFYKCIFGH